MKHSRLIVEELIFTTKQEASGGGDHETKQPLQQLNEYLEQKGRATTVVSVQQIGTSYLGAFRSSTAYLVARYV